MKGRGVGTEFFGKCFPECFFFFLIFLRVFLGMFYRADFPGVFHKCFHWFVKGFSGWSRCLVFFFGTLSDVKKKGFESVLWFLGFPKCLMGFPCFRCFECVFGVVWVLFLCFFCGFYGFVFPSF